MLKDGQCDFSNNSVERQIKSFVIGRKNYLFCKNVN
ncbi:IS66 family transposase [Anaerophilus nitritogenes]|nr:IS66 family transposase [Anaerophilus nitritogenes]